MMGLHHVCGLVCLVLLPLIVGGENSQDICKRDAPETTASRTPGDNGFRIKIAAQPQPERYTPEQVYTVIINGTYSNQKLLGFMLVAVPLNANDESTAMGNFQHLNSGVTQFVPECPHVVTHTYSHPKAGVEVLWTAPPAGTGCIEFRATVIEYTDIWYKDDGALTRVFCEETGTTENHVSPELLPDCCACGTAKYQMTFHGTWSRRTHPKDYPSRKRLLHWSNIVGASHSKHYTIWQYGGYSSRGVKQVCEFGYTRILEQEMRQHSRDVRTVVKTPGIWWSDPHGLEQTRWARFSVDRKNHLVSMLTMLGPSPDWCVGISAVNLCVSNCTWMENFEIDLFPWDGGTDDGITYMAPNKVSDPQQKIHRMTNTFPNSPEAPFYGRDPIPPLATLKIRRIHPKSGDDMKCTGSAEDFDEDFVGIEESDDLTIDEEEKNKQLLTKQGKCAMSDWTDWSKCSVTCGVGQRFRKRSYVDQRMDENACGQTVLESENCIGVENECESADEPCSVSRWSDWSPCSATCGKGTRERRRFYFRSNDITSCDRKLEEKEICMAEILDCSKALDQMNFTAICSLPRSIGTCRGDFQRFFYDTGMNKCLLFSYTGCRGNNNNFMTEQECKEGCFPVMKEAILKEMEKEKNSQDVDKTTEIVSPEEEDDPKVTCALPSETGACRASLTRYYFDKDMVSCLPFTYGGCKGNANNFLTEDACMDECFMVMKDEMLRRRANADKESNKSGKKNNKKDKKKTNKSDEKERGNKKDGKKPKKLNKNTDVVPRSPDAVDCAITKWSDWSTCSATCGRGYKYKRRTVTGQPKKGGKKCPKRLEKKKKCKMPRCRGRCKMSNWGPWTPCPKTCGSGSIQERTRQVVSAPEGNISQCGPRIERRYCTLPPCPRDDHHRAYRSP